MLTFHVWVLNHVSWDRDLLVHWILLKFTCYGSLASGNNLFWFDLLQIRIAQGRNSEKKPLVDAIPIEILNGISIIPYPHVFVWLSYLSPIAYTYPLNITMEYASIMVGFLKNIPMTWCPKTKITDDTSISIVYVYIHIYIYLYLYPLYPTKSVYPPRIKRGNWTPFLHRFYQLLTSIYR